MKSSCHVIIVGSGPAGLAAAEILSMHGLRILMIDDNAHTGGQLLQKPLFTGKRGKRFEPDGLKRRGRRLARRVQRGAVQFLNDARVLGIYPRHTLLVEESRGHVSEHHAETLILATGARERHLPFKGWTLPGVMSTGAAQILMKSSGVLPGSETLIAGCTPLMWVLAAEIIANRGKVPAILDHSPATMKFKALTAGPAIWPKLLEGAGYLARLATARVPIKHEIRIVEARGPRQLAEVVAAGVDDGGRVVPGTERTYPIGTLAVGYGFSPNIELPQQAGCRIAFSKAKGGWFVAVNNAMETTVENIYAAGETTGIAGAGKSFVEGRIAAWDILRKHDLANRKTSKTEILPLTRQRNRQVRYGRFLNLMCRPQPGCYADIPDETVICRCEEVTMGTIRKETGNDFTTMNGIKNVTRLGMGNCQGRICGPVLFDILSARKYRPPEAIGTVSARVPVKTVSLGALAKMTTSAEKEKGAQTSAE